jgi:membrane fusion protein, multidrug efflux system
MKRALKWGIPVLALLLVSGLVARTIHLRQTERNAVTGKTALVLALGPGDVVVARTRDLARTLDVSGGLKAVNSAFIKARVGSELQSLSVREGDPVKAGQVIGQLDTIELDLRLRQAEQNAQSSKAQLDIARRALENNRGLVAQGFISPTALETSVSNEAAAAATYEAAAAAVGLARKAKVDAQLVAPIGGIVSQRLVQPGERVSLDSKIVEIVDLSRIELEAALAPEDVAGIRIGQAARLQVDGFADPVAATVARINPSTQPGTRAVMVYLAVKPHPGLRQGLFAKGSIEMQRRPALLVPANAVRIDQAAPYVVAVADGKAVQRRVELGARGEAERVDGSGREPVVELKSGVAEGAVLVAGSVGQVQDGTAVDVTAPAAAASAPR